MKLHADKSDAPRVGAYGPGWIELDGERIQHSIVFSSRGHRADWPCQGYEDLGPGHFEQLALDGVELVIFGSGERIRFPRPEWLAALVQRGIGLETMDTAAACRTYNVLAAEGRHAVAALLL